jgi:hypothetical protein
LEIEDSRDRVLTRLNTTHDRIGSYNVPIWRRRVAVPLPIAVVLSCIILVSAVVNILMYARGGGIPLSITTAPSGVTKIQVAAPSIEDIQLLLESLEDKDLPREITTIQLPKDTPFMILGEPVLLPASDFERTE